MMMATMMLLAEVQKAKLFKVSETKEDHKKFAIKIHFDNQTKELLHGQYLRHRETVDSKRIPKYAIEGRNGMIHSSCT